MPPNKMPVYAATVMYEDINSVRKLLLNIRGQTQKIDGVIIVDNSEQLRVSQDDIVDLTDIRPLYYYRFPQNMGSAAGFAFGMAAALKICEDKSPCWIWLNDSDGYPGPNCLETMLSDCAENPDVGILCPVVYDAADKTFEDTTFRRFLTKWGTTYRCRAVSGRQFINLAGTSGIMVNSRLIEKIGVYDYEHFFVNLEDYEYSLRAFRQSKESVILCPEARYFHPISPHRHGLFRLKHKLPIYMGTYKNDGNPREEKYVYSAAFLVGKHLNKAQRIVTYGYSLVRLLLTGLFVRNVSIKSTLQQYACGYKDGRNSIGKNYTTWRQADNDLFLRLEAAISLF